MELHPQRSASNTSALVEIVMSKTLCRTSAPTAGAPGLGSMASFHLKHRSATCDHVLSKRADNACSGERRQNATVHLYLATPPAQRSRRGRSQLPYESQSRNGVLTAPRPVYRLRTQHRPPTLCGPRAEARLRYRVQAPRAARLSRRPARALWSQTLLTAARGRGDACILRSDFDGCDHWHGWCHRCHCT